MVERRGKDPGPTTNAAPQDGERRHPPIIVASENGRAGALAAMALLRSGGSALDAVEIACRVTEDDPEDQSVGTGGLPNVLGEVELDASIMDGRTLRTGAVAAVRGYGNPVTLARHVLTDLPHELLVAHGAERLAQEIGLTRVNLNREASEQRWRQRFLDRKLAPQPATQDLRFLVSALIRPVDSPFSPEPEARDQYGTVNYLALDCDGNLATAVSTSGRGWKYPGRVGDSPIIGAGNYCDNRYGAVTCTGLGELAIRVSTARSVVLYLKMGMSAMEAGQEGLRDLADLVDRSESADRYMNFLLLTPQGEHHGFSTVGGKRYLYLRDTMAEPELVDRVVAEELTE